MSILRSLNVGMPSPGTLAFGAMALTTGGAMIRCMLQQSNQPNWQRVGVVEKLFVHPLKGGKLKETTTLNCEELGPRAALFRDRSFTLMNDEGNMVTSKEYPKLLLVDLVFQDGNLWFKAPDMDPICVDADDLKFSKEKQVTMKMLDVLIQATYVGPKYDEFFSMYCSGRPSGIRLVYQSPVSSNGFQRAARPKYRELWPETYFSKGCIPAFSYMTPYTILTTASVDDLNDRLPEGKKKVSAEWFRPNILIKTEDGKPYQEDEWTGYVRIGKSVELFYNKPCNRCPVICIDPDLGERDCDLEPLRTLRQYRLVDPSKSEHDKKVRKALGESPMFMTNLSLLQSGQIEVGDEVWVQVPK